MRFADLVVDIQIMILVFLHQSILSMGTALLVLLTRRRSAVLLERTNRKRAGSNKKEVAVFVTVAMMQTGFSLTISKNFFRTIKCDCMKITAKSILRHGGCMKLCYRVKMHRGVGGMFVCSSCLCSWFNNDWRIYIRRQSSLPMISELWKSPWWSGLTCTCSLMGTCSSNSTGLTYIKLDACILFAGFY